jgi:2-dehydropantoate 2-reductase
LVVCGRACWFPTFRAEPIRFHAVTDPFQQANLEPLSIVGAGSLGQAMAVLLASHGGSPVLVATARTADVLLAAGRIELEGSSEASAAVGSSLEPGTVCVRTVLPADQRTGVVFATKAHDLASAAEQVAEAGEAVSWVAGLQNGLAKDEILAQAFGRQRVVGASTIFAAQRRENGFVRVTNVGKTFLGELDGGISRRVRDAVTALAPAGIPAEARADMPTVLWTKACNATGAFGVSVLAGPTAPPTGYDPNLMRAFLTLVRETASVARAEGVEVEDMPEIATMRTYISRPVEETIAALPPPPPPGTPRGFPSMLQDRLAGRPMEIEQVFGDIVERAGRTGVPVPCLAFTLDLLRGIAAGA